MTMAVKARGTGMPACQSVLYLKVNHASAWAFKNLLVRVALAPLTRLMVILQPFSRVMACTTSCACQTSFANWLRPILRICDETAMSGQMQRHQKFVQVLDVSSLLQTHVCELSILQSCTADCMDACLTVPAATRVVVNSIKA